MRLTGPPDGMSMTTKKEVGAKKAAPKKPAAKKPAAKRKPSVRKPAASAKKSYVEKVFTWFNPSVEKARLIAERYVIDYNPVEALKAGGYADSSINSHGHVIIRHPRIVAEVEALQAAVREKVLIDESYVLDGLKLVAEKSMGRSPITRLDEEGNTIVQTTFNPSAATKALEQIGRHLGMFKDVLEVREEMTVEEWVSLVEKEANGRGITTH